MLMQTIKGALRSLPVIIAALTLTVSASVAHAQNALQFTDANSTPEKAIQLHWASTNGELYQIQYANALATNDDGSTAWQVLYDKYPSHGTNTFIGDFGNYDIDPAVPHPKYAPMRFYRVVDLGPAMTSLMFLSSPLHHPRTAAFLQERLPFQFRPLAATSPS